MGHATRRGPSRRPAVVIIPQLQMQTVHERTARAFDSSVNAILRRQFRERPSASEMNTFRRFVEQATVSLGMTDARMIVREFSRTHPDSVIARYFRATESADWILTRDSIRPASMARPDVVRFVRFSTRALHDSVRKRLSTTRQDFLQRTLHAFANQYMAYVDATRMARMMPGLAEELARRMGAQFRRGRNRLPMSVEFDSAKGHLVVSYERARRRRGT